MNSAQLNSNFSERPSVAEGISQLDFSKKLKLSRATQIVKILGVPETVLIQLALQDSLHSAKLNYVVELKKVQIQLLRLAICLIKSALAKTQQLCHLTNLAPQEW